MTYTKSSQNAGSEEDQNINTTLAIAGITVLSAAWGFGVLTIETDQALPLELEQSLGFVAQRE